MVYYKVISKSVVVLCSSKILIINLNFIFNSINIKFKDHSDLDNVFKINLYKFKLEEIYFF